MNLGREPSLFQPHMGVLMTSRQFILSNRSFCKNDTGTFRCVIISSGYQSDARSHPREMPVRTSVGAAKSVV